MPDVLDVTQTLSRVRTALAPDIERVFDQEFFRTLKSGVAAPKYLKKFAAEYYIASSGFPRILAAACARMPSDELRLPIVQNLWDEHGCGDSNKSHRAMLRRLLNFLALPIPDEKQDGPAQDYVRDMLSLCATANEAEVIGILGPGCEAYTPRQYRLIVNAFLAVLRTPDHALEFFLDHIGHDHEHIGALNSALMLVAGHSQGLDDVVHGAKKAIEIECRFWHDLHNLCLV